MPKVTNNASSSRGLLFKGPLKAGAVAGPAMFERVVIAPGETVECDQKFLDSEGAKALIACGDLSLGGQASEPSEAATTEPKGETKPAKKAAKKAASKK